MKRKVFQWFTITLLLLSVWTAYANVLSDDTEVRAKARAALNAAAGCGDNCKIEGIRGDRGMFGTEIEYDLVKHGHYVVVCRRAFVVAGDWACQVTEGKITTAASAAPAGSSSATR